MKGRPSKLTPENLERCVQLYLEGASDRDVAGSLGVSPTTIQNWKKQRKFKPALLAKGRIDADVVSKLKMRAMGFSYTETREIFDASGALARKEVTTRKVAPDVGAQRFWLTNRNPDEWANKEVVEHYDGEKGIDIINRGRARVAELRKRREEEGNDD